MQTPRVANVLIAIGVATGMAARASGDSRPTFKWPTPCVVPVTEVGLKDGNTVKMSYDVAVERRDDELYLQMQNYAFLEVNGRDMTTAEMRKTMREATLMTAAVPAIRISTSGAYLGIINLENTVTKLLENPSFRRPGGDSEKFRQALLSPQMRTSFENEMSAIWSTWVGRWLDHVPASGKRLSLTEQHQIGNATLASPTTISNLGTVSGAPGTVRLRSEGEMHGKQLARQLSTVLSNLIADLGAKDTLPGMLTDGERRVVMEVDTDVSTLQPRRALSHMKLKLKFKDGKERSFEQRRETTFHWDLARGECAQHQ